MFVNTNQIQVGLYNFIDKEIGAKAVNMDKFAIYFLLPIIIKKAADYVNSFKDNEFTKDFFNSNGDVDLDAIYNMSKQAIQKSGQFTICSKIGGVILGESDIDRLYNYIKNTSV